MDSANSPFTRADPSELDVEDLISSREIDDAAVALPRAPHHARLPKKKDSASEYNDNIHNKTPSTGRL